MAEALRYNNDKPMMSYFMRSFPRMTEGIARVMESGANKYDDGNWKLGNKPDDEYWNSLFRHLGYHFDGDWYDPDSGCMHLAHAVWNICALLELNHGEKPAIDEELFRERMEFWAKEKAKRKAEEATEPVAGPREWVPPPLDLEAAARAEVDIAAGRTRRIEDVIAEFSDESDPQGCHTRLATHPPVEGECCGACDTVPPLQQSTQAADMRYLENLKRINSGKSAVRFEIKDRKKLDVMQKLQDDLNGLYKIFTLEEVGKMIDKSIRDGVDPFTFLKDVYAAQVNQKKSEDYERVAKVLSDWSKNYSQGMKDECIEAALHHLRSEGQAASKAFAKWEENNAD